tara:strand:+ start:257 stop:868 length:612 start_codon:yes stop_codon:yes gene_type:complete
MKSDLDFKPPSIIRSENVDFENIGKKFSDLISNKDYLKCCEQISNKSKIIIIANGGLHYVAGHMACDMSRLISNKSFFSFDSVGFITSNANDYGFDNIFTRWMETIALAQDYDSTMVIGLSCSGRSKNVLNGLEWSKSRGIPSWMISGTNKHADFLTVELNCTYYHTVEALCLMMFYDMIHKVGHKCPSIESNYADSKKRTAH